MAQQRQTYHHKNLRNTLIETGIRIVSEEGINGFSLRKVSAACGVSHAAPYSHFQNKEELLEAMQLFITDRFSEQLENAVQKSGHAAEALKNMGIAYISFFTEKLIFSFNCYKFDKITNDHASCLSKFIQIDSALSHKEDNQVYFSPRPIVI